MKTGSITGPASSPRAEWSRVAARSRLFVSSYAPAFLIFAVRFDGLVLRLCCASIAIVGVADAWLVTRAIWRRTIPFLVSPRHVEDVGGEVAGYLASYLLPFVTVSRPTVRDLLGYGLYLLVALVIYVRSDLVRVNPTMYALGYRIFRLDYGNVQRQYLIARVEPRVGEPVEAVDIAGILLSRGPGPSAQS